MGRVALVTDQRHKQVTCKLWDRDVTPGDRTVRLASDGKRRLNAPPWRPPSEEQPWDSSSSSASD